MELPLNQIINEDCLIFMKTLPDKCIDLVLTDPPYGINMGGMARDKANIKDGKSIRKQYDYSTWDIEIPSKEIFEQIERISKNQVICGGNYFVEHLNRGHKGWVIWDKAQRGLDMSDCELIYSSFDCPTRIFTLHRAKLWAEKPEHPTQKPMELMRYLVDKFSKEGEIIFDPFMGSGTTGKMALILKRKYIGSEISEEYTKLAEERINQFSNPLF